MNKFITIFFCLLLTFGISGNSSATVIDTNVELNGVTLSGFRSDSNNNLEWIDLDEKNWSFDWHTKMITEPTYGWRLATYSEWNEMAEDLSIGEFTLDEWNIIGGNYSTQEYYMALGLVEFTSPNTQTGAIEYRYSSAITSFWPGDSVADQMPAWMVREQAPVPEPVTMILFGIGLLSLAGVSRRKK